MSRHQRPIKFYLQICCGIVISDGFAPADDVVSRLIEEDMWQSDSTRSKKLDRTEPIACRCMDDRETLDGRLKTDFIAAQEALSDGDQLSAQR